MKVFISLHLTFLIWKLIESIPILKFIHNIFILFRHQVSMDELLPTSYHTECVCMHAQSLSCAQLFLTSGTAALQASLSMGFSKQENGWVAIFLLRGILLIQGPNPVSPSLTLAGGFFTTTTGEYWLLKHLLQNTSLFFRGQWYELLFCRIKMYLIEYLQVVDRWFTN